MTIFPPLGSTTSKLILLAGTPNRQLYLSLFSDSTIREIVLYISLPIKEAGATLVVVVTVQKICIEYFENGSFQACIGAIAWIINFGIGINILTIQSDTSGPSRWPRGIILALDQFTTVTFLSINRNNTLGVRSISIPGGTDNVLERNEFVTASGIFHIAPPITVMLILPIPH
jgi:hypothetical protein